jgi:protein-tyrosine phosphatase
VTSGPSSVWPKKAYRNPLDQLVSFLDKKHREDWAIFEFRAEGTGYPDSKVYNRIHHFPWPDHHPPPFAIIPNLMAAMRNWIQRLDSPDGLGAEGQERRVAVVHCKAGKGRSGTSACSYLISEEGWDRDEALKRFTARRMRAGFGNGVSIPSQLRWVGYVDRWTNKLGKRYIERPVEILEVHVEGLRDGVKVAVEGYEDNGRRIENFHIFSRQEKTVIEDGIAPTSYKTTKHDAKKGILSTPSDTPNSSTHAFHPTTAANTQTVILRPAKPIILPTSDVNIDFERRNQASIGMSMVTSIAHVWFNAFFEGGAEGDHSGVFEIEWEAMDGIKGSARKGSKALDRLKVVWRYATQANGQRLEKVITEPERGEPVSESEPADWRGANPNPENEKGARHSDGVDSGRPGGSLLTMGATINTGAASIARELGLREQSPESHGVSRAHSPGGEVEGRQTATAEVQRAGEEEEDGADGVKSNYGDDEDLHEVHDEGVEGRKDTKVGQGMEAGLEKMTHVVAKWKGTDGHEGHKGHEESQQ